MRIPVSLSLRSGRLRVERSGSGEALRDDSPGRFAVAGARKTLWAARDQLTLATMTDPSGGDTPKARAYMLDWDERYRKGEIIWDKGAPSPPMRQYLERHAVHGRALVPGCGHGHEVALAAELGLDVTGLDIAPTGVAKARALYPHLAERFVVGDLFDPPKEMRGAFDVVLEHTCLSGLHPALRADYRRGIDLTLRPGGLLIGVWFINPDLDPGEAGPPFPLSVADLTALFAEGYEIVEDYVPEVAFVVRVGRERVRVLRRAG